MSTPSNPSPRIQSLLSRASTSSINLTSLPFLPTALSSISSLPSPLPPSTPQSHSFQNATRIDTHTHPIPPWFRALEPQAAGRATPEWNVSSHLEFMAAHGIKRSVLSVSTPQANAFASEPDAELRKQRTIALARLLNEYVAEVVRVHPERFSWLCVAPLPYVEESVKEVEYAMGELGAVGVSVLTNHEGVYPGDGTFDGLWESLERRGGRQVVMVHPTEPAVRVDGRIINSRPSPLRSGLGEFYFETARAISSITAESTITKFPNIHWRVSHGAGAFPDISERFLLGFPNEAEAARKAYKERFWYDSAGPVFPNQVKGLTEGLKIPISQFVFGTDYPYGIGFWDVDANIYGLSDADFLSQDEKEQVFWRNAEALWEGKLH